MPEKNHTMPALTDKEIKDVLRYANSLKNGFLPGGGGEHQRHIEMLTAQIAIAALTAESKTMRRDANNDRTWIECGKDYHLGRTFYTAPPVPELPEAPIPKNLDRALTVMGVALPESVEEFNFHSDRWVQRLINRVIGLGPELDAERQKWQEERDALRAQLDGLAMQQPVRYLNKFSGVCLTLEQQPNAHENRAVYQPLFCQAGPADTPAGWKLVPVEPTEDMIINGFESAPDELFSKPEEWEAYEAMSGCQQAAHRAKLCWLAMLSSAPETR